MVGKKGVLFIGALGLGVLPFQGFSQEAQAQQVQMSKETQKGIEKLKEHELAKIIKEAADVVQETHQVLLLLQNGKLQEALTLLEKVRTSLKTLIQQYGLVKLPVDVQFVEYDGVEDLDTAWKYNKEVKEVISKNDFVDGRFILALLRDEIDIVTTYLPLDLYAKAVELAYVMLKGGETQGAILALQSALSTLEIETVIVPKPVLEAQVLLDEAQQVYKVNPERALKLLSRAEYDLKLTVALGYAPSLDTLKDLLNKIEQLKTAIKTHAATTEEQFQQTKETMEKFREQTTKNPAPSKQ